MPPRRRRISPHPVELVQRPTASRRRRSSSPPSSPLQAEPRSKRRRSRSTSRSRDSDSDNELIDRPATGRAMNPASLANLRQGGQGVARLNRDGGGRLTSFTEEGLQEIERERSQKGTESATAERMQEEASMDRALQADAVSTDEDAEAEVEDLSVGGGISTDEVAEDKSEEEGNENERNETLDTEEDEQEDSEGEIDWQADDEEWEDWEKYVLEINDGYGYLRKMGTKLWLVQGWSRKNSNFSPSWFHLKLDSPPSTVSCTCSSLACVHTLAFQNEPTIFTTAPSIQFHEPLPDVVPFSAKPRFDYGFSVQQTYGQYDSGKRVIVTVDPDGVWRCSSQQCTNRFANCLHVNSAKRKAVVMGWVPPDMREVEQDLGNQDAEVQREADEEEGSDDENQEREKESREFAISQARRGPPSALRLDTEHDRRYPLLRAPPRHQIPRLLELDQHSRCRFGHRLDAIPEEARRSLERTRTPYTIYTMEGVRKVKIETVKCTKCRRRIGPDLIEHGLFNWNNSIGFTRQVFDDYISRLTSGQNTILAFHKQMSDTYFGVEKGGQICSEPTLRRAFFAFLRVIAIESGMKCEKCGSNPKIVICDGCVIGFEKRRLEGYLRNPTLPTTDSVVKRLVKAFALSAVSTDTLGVAKEVVEKIRKSAHAWSKNNLQNIPEALHLNLHFLDVSDGESFPAAFSALVARIGESVERNERSALKELLSQLVAKHPMFFIVPPSAFEELDHFGRTGRSTLKLRQQVPILGKLYEFGPIEEVRQLFSALTKLARSVWQRLLVNSQDTRLLTPEILELARRKEQAHPALEDPLQIGSFYGSRKLRSRNIYPHLKDDAGEKRLRDKPVKDSDELQESCAKRFDLFGSQGLVGGICGTWCTHGICVAHHL
ncbi:hypothetical protein JCM5350_007048 [Sporobolomyces pararoseus]